MKKALYFFLLVCQCPVSEMVGFSIPGLNLGFTSFLDGGPLRPNPGWYWEQYVQYYTAHKFLDACGKPLGGVSSPRFDSVTGVTELIYQSDQEIVRTGRWGLSSAIIYDFLLTVERNCLNIRSSGNGLGNLYLGAFIQWDSIERADGTPLFIHRAEFDAVFPVGKNKPGFFFNPGDGFFFIDPYWAVTLYFTKDWSLSWRIHYLWCAENRKTKKQAGDAVHLNYALAYQLTHEEFYIGINGYFLQQLHDDKQCGKSIPNTRERIFAAGPGMLYSPTEDLNIFANLYFESLARNRTQGISFIFRWLLHF